MQRNNSTWKPPRLSVLQPEVMARDRRHRRKFEAQSTGDWMGWSSGWLYSVVSPGGAVSPSHALMYLKTFKISYYRFSMCRFLQHCSEETFRFSAAARGELITKQLKHTELPPQSWIFFTAVFCKKLSQIFSGTFTELVVVWSERTPAGQNKVSAPNLYHEQPFFRWPVPAINGKMSNKLQLIW